MSNSFFMLFRNFFIVLLIFTIFICIFFVPIISISGETSSSFIISASGYVWPTPGYTTINSYFGKRYSPTAGASSYHKGIDIGAPQGSQLVAITSGKITFTGFLGGGRLYHYINR